MPVHEILFTLERPEVEQAAPEPESSTGVHQGNARLQISTPATLLTQPGIYLHKRTTARLPADYRVVSL